MPSKRHILEALSRDELLDVVDRFEVVVPDRRRKAALVDALVASRRVDLTAFLLDWPRDDLKSLCRDLGLEDGGREKAVIVARLVGGHGEESLPRALPAEGVRHSPKVPARTTPTDHSTKVPARSSRAQSRDERTGTGGGIPLPTRKPTSMRTFSGFSEIANFLWSVADLLRGDYKQSDYGKVILPMTVLRRLDCVLADSKAKVLAKHEALKGSGMKNLDPVLNRLTGVPFHSVSRLDFEKLKGDPVRIAENLTAYIKGFSPNARDIFIERFRFPEQIAKLDEANLLFQVVSRFAEVDLHPSAEKNLLRLHS